MDSLAEVRCSLDRHSTERIELTDGDRLPASTSLIAPIVLVSTADIAQVMHEP
jgi:hypothetical protein